MARRPARAVTLALAAAMGAATLARPARADPPPRARLAVARMTGAEACPDGEALARDVARRLGRNPFDPTATRLLEVVLLRQAGAWVARIFVRDAPGAPPGVRELTSETPACDHLASSVALALALAVDPEAPISAALPRGTSGASSGATTGGASGTGASASANANGGRVEGAAAGNANGTGRADGGGNTAARDGRAGGTAAATAARNGGRPAPGAWDAAARVTLRGGVALGLLPRPALALVLGFDPPRTGPGHFTFGAMLLPEALSVAVSSAGAEVFHDGEFSFGLTSGWLGYCLGVAGDRVAIDGCAVFHAGVAHAVPHTLEPVHPGDYPWLALGLEGRASLRLIDQLALELQVTPLVPLIHQRYLVEQMGVPREPPVFEPWYVAFAATAGLRLRFW